MRFVASVRIGAVEDSYDDLVQYHLPFIGAALLRLLDRFDREFKIRARLDVVLVQRYAPWFSSGAGETGYPQLKPRDMSLSLGTGDGDGAPLCISSLPFSEISALWEKVVCGGSSGGAVDRWTSRLDRLVRTQVECLGRHLAKRTESRLQVRVGDIRLVPLEEPGGDERVVERELVEVSRVRRHLLVLDHRLERKEAGTGRRRPPYWKATAAVPVAEWLARAARGSWLSGLGPRCVLLTRFPQDAFSLAPVPLDPSYQTASKQVLSEMVGSGPLELEALAELPAVKYAATTIYRDMARSNATVALLLEADESDASRELDECISHVYHGLDAAVPAAPRALARWEPVTFVGALAAGDPERETDNPDDALERELSPLVERLVPLTWIALLRPSSGVRGGSEARSAPGGSALARVLPRLPCWIGTSVMARRNVWPRFAWTERAGAAGKRGALHAAGASVGDPTSDVRLRSDPRPYEVSWANLPRWVWEAVHELPSQVSVTPLGTPRKAQIVVGSPQASANQQIFEVTGETLGGRALVKTVQVTLRIGGDVVSTCQLFEGLIGGLRRLAAALDPGVLGSGVTMAPTMITTGVEPLDAFIYWTDLGLLQAELAQELVTYVSRAAHIGGILEWWITPTHTNEQRALVIPAKRHASELDGDLERLYGCLVETALRRLLSLAVGEDAGSFDLFGGESAAPALAARLTNGQGDSGWPVVRSILAGEPDSPTPTERRQRLESMRRAVITWWLVAFLKRAGKGADQQIASLCAWLRQSLRIATVSHLDKEVPDFLHRWVRPWSEYLRKKYDLQNNSCWLPWTALRSENRKFLAKVERSPDAQGGGDGHDTAHRGSGRALR